jgi:hypothetical protein
MRYAVIFLLGVICCTRHSVTDDDLADFVREPENGLLQSVKKGEMSLEACYKPRELVLKQQLKGLTDPVEKQRLEKGIDTLDYFVLRLARSGKEIERSYSSSPDQFTKAVNYLSNSLTKDLFILQNGDTLLPLDVVFVRAFGVADGTTVMAVFATDLKRRTGSANLVFDDHFFDSGVTTFHYEISDLKKLPKLILN